MIKCGEEEEGKEREREGKKGVLLCAEVCECARERRLTSERQAGSQASNVADIIILR